MTSRNARVHQAATAARGLLAWSLTAAVWAGAAGGCTDPKRPIGAQCARNSDCQALLICVTGACRAECREDRDCPPDHTCEPSDVIDRRVCLPPDTPRPCALASDCPTDAACEQGLCYRTCIDDAGCADGGSCIDGVCSEPLTTEPRPIDGGVDTGPPPVCTDTELATGLVPCGALCVDLSSDPDHCGECGLGCVTAECSDGLCAPPNDDFEDATPVAIEDGPAMVRGSAVGASHTVGSCSDRPDVFFSFELLRRELVHVRIGEGEARVGFVAAAGEGADGCSAGTDVRVLDPGTYTVVIDPVTDEFQLVIEHVGVTGTPSGRFAAGMAASPFGGTTLGSEDSPGTCGGGPDNFYWWLTDRAFSGGTFEASTCAGAAHDTTLEVAHGDGTRSCDGADGCGAQSFLSATVPPGEGLHVLFVDGASASDEGSYTVTVTVP